MTRYLPFSLKIQGVQLKKGKNRAIQCKCSVYRAPFEKQGSLVTLSGTLYLSVHSFNGHGTWGQQFTMNIHTW